MLDEKIHATRQERNLVQLTIDPAERMVLCGAVERTVRIVRDKVARGRRCDVVDDLFSHRGNANQSRCLQKSFFFSRMVCTDHIDHDSHILGFGLTDQILQIGFASERFIQRVDVLKKDHHIAKYQRCTRNSHVDSEHPARRWGQIDSPGSSNRGTTRQAMCSLRYSSKEGKFGLTISFRCQSSFRSGGIGVEHSPRRWARSKSTMTEKRVEYQNGLSSVSTRKGGGDLVRDLRRRSPCP